MNKAERLKMERSADRLAILRYLGDGLWHGLSFFDQKFAQDRQPRTIPVIVNTLAALEASGQVESKMEWGSHQHTVWRLRRRTD